LIQDFVFYYIRLLGKGQNENITDSIQNSKEGKRGQPLTWDKEKQMVKDSKFIEQRAVIRMYAV